MFQHIAIEDVKTMVMTKKQKNTQHTHTLFLFSGATNRTRIFKEMMCGENADTALHGANHIPDAEWIDVAESVSAFMSPALYRLLPWQLRSIFLFRRVRRYSVVIAQDDLPLGWLVSMVSRFSNKKTRWIAFAVNSSVLMHRHKHHPLRLWLLTFFWKSYEKIICLSNEQIADFIHLGIPRERLTFIPFGIDANFYASVNNAHETDLVVSVGRDLGRDYNTLFDVAKRIDYKFAIAADYKNIPEDTSLPPNVSVQYNLPLTEIRNLYARARIVVITLKDADIPDGSDCSGQTVILDAMAAGKPVITTDRPWIKDYFLIDKEILVVPPRDSIALTTAIRKLLSNDEMRVRLAAAGRAKVWTQYTTKNFARKLEKLISF